MPQDKKQHMIAGALIACLPVPAQSALALVAIAGAGKEIYDYFHPENHTCDFGDFAATVAGGLIVFGVRLYAAS